MPWETGRNVPSIMSHLQLLQENEREFFPSACVLCDPATVRQRDLQPSLRACVSVASVCGPPCVWVMPAALTVDQSVYRSSADQLGPPSVCWRCPAASSTTDSATSSGDRPESQTSAPSRLRSRGARTHIYSGQFIDRKFPVMAQKIKIYQKIKGEKKWI